MSETPEERFPPEEKFPLRHLVASVDPRLRGKTIMITEDGLVMVQMQGGWQTVREDYSVKIDLAPPSSNMLVGGLIGATPHDYQGYPAWAKECRGMKSDR